MATMSSHEARLAELNELKKRKYLQQKEAARKMNEALTAPDGMNENSRLKVKNLAAGIVASRQPGYFHYHEDNERVAQIEQSNTIPKLNADIQRIGDEIVRIDHEIAELKQRMKRPVEPPKMDSLAQWVATYGKVEEPNPDRVTSFKKSSKVYGGTKHYPAFKSVSTTMKPGLCTK